MHACTIIIYSRFRIHRYNVLMKLYAYRYFVLPLCVLVHLSFTCVSVSMNIMCLRNCMFVVIPIYFYACKLRYKLYANLDMSFIFMHVNLEIEYYWRCMLCRFG